METHPLENMFSKAGALPQVVVVSSFCDLFH